MTAAHWLALGFLIFVLLLWISKIAAAIAMDQARERDRE